jgi:hypothetical protein
MNWCHETAEKGVPARSGEAGEPPGNRRELVPRRTLMVRRRAQHPRTHGGLAISVVRLRRIHETFGLDCDTQ